MSPQILVQEKDWIALDKPAGMLTLPDRHNDEIISVKQWMAQQFPANFVVHRIDKETSGVLLWALSAEMHKYLSALFTSRNISKKYVALVYGNPLHDEGLIEAPIMEHPAKDGTMIIHAKGKYASTGYTVLERFGRYTWMSFDLHTGRTHQIRLHCKHAGFSIVADPLYGDGQPFYVSAIKKKFKTGKFEEEKPLINRTALHASSLAFTMPDGTEHCIEAPVPKDLRAALQQLRKWS